MPTLTPDLARKITAKCIALEAKIDPILFRKSTPEEEAQNNSGRSMGGALALTGGAAIGATMAHKHVMANYGGAEGGVKEAYRNAGRNALRSAQEGAAGVGSAVSARVAPVLGSVKSAVGSIADRTGKSYTAAREIAGLSPLASGLRAAKKGVNPLISRVLAAAARFRK